MVEGFAGLPRESGSTVGGLRLVSREFWARTGKPEAPHQGDMELRLKSG